MTTLARYPYCCGNCGTTEIGTEAPEGWVYSEVVDAGPLADYSYWLCEGCSYDIADSRSPYCSRCDYTREHEARREAQRAAREAGR